MALDKQLWISTIQEALFKNDEFLNTVGQDHSGYVNNKTVHVPQAGAAPTITKNATTFPLSVEQRTDVDLEYNVNLYYSPPIRIGVDETQFISYDKRASVLQSVMKKLRNVMGNNTLYAWAPTTSIVRTTGSAYATLAPGATGTRKAPTLADFQTARSVLGAQNLNPADSIYAIVPEIMYWKLISDTNISKNLEWGAEPSAPSGKVAMIAGVKLLRRSSVVVYNNDSTPVIKSINDEGTPSSPATTDNMGILVISESYVSKALGAIDVFTNDKRAEYFGDIISAVVAHGASKLRTNEEGICAIVQAA
jgi:hypothetical protein